MCIYGTVDDGDDRNDTALHLASEVVNPIHTVMSHDYSLSALTAYLIHYLPPQNDDLPTFPGVPCLCNGLTQ